MAASVFNKLTAVINTLLINDQVMGPRDKAQTIGRPLWRTETPKSVSCVLEMFRRLILNRLKEFFISSANSGVNEIISSMLPSLEM